LVVSAHLLPAQLLATARPSSAASVKSSAFSGTSLQARTCFLMESVDKQPQAALCLARACCRYAQRWREHAQRAVAIHVFQGLVGDAGSGGRSATRYQRTACTARPESSPRRRDVDV
jgi:hypothetical protein